MGWGWEVLIHLCSVSALCLNLLLFHSWTLEISISKYTTQTKWLPLPWFHACNNLASRSSIQQPPNKADLRGGAIWRHYPHSRSHSLIAILLLDWGRQKNTANDWNWNIFFFLKKYLLNARNVCKHNHQYVADSLKHMCFTALWFLYCPLLLQLWVSYNLSSSIISVILCGHTLFQEGKLLLDTSSLPIHVQLILSSTAFYRGSRSSQLLFWCIFRWVYQI